MRYCTIAARNYLSHVRVLARSLAEHDEGRLVVLVLDDVERDVDARDEPFDVVRPEDLALSRREFHVMATIYDVVELATALKPWLFDMLLDHGAAPVSYLDPDMVVFGPLDEARALADRHPIVLTPHLTEPMPRDGLFPDELFILRAGVYNLGFLALSPASGPFREWWKERLRRDCRVAVEEGIFVDQRWVDMVPALFDHAVLRDPGYDVAYWNLGTRRIRREGRAFMVDGRPLRLFHFSGFSPLRPHELSRHQGEKARVHLADHPALARVCSRYATELLDAGYLDAQQDAYRYDYTAHGERIDRRLRVAYRTALREREEAAAPDPAGWLPDPFDPVEVRAFFALLLGTPDDLAAGVVPPYFADLHRSRPDLQIAFPGHAGTATPGFADWLERGARLEGSVPLQFLPAFRPPRAHLVRPRAERLEEGVNIVGYLDAEDGVGEVARQFARVLSAADVDHALVPYHQTPSRRLAAMPSRAGTERFDVNLLCINADELPAYFVRTIDTYHRPHGAIAVWAWEVARFPEWMRASNHFVDEIWVYSEHAARAVGPMTDRPVVVVPPPVAVPETPSLGRAALGLPEGFLFLFCFSYFSVFERKNPLAVVEAFTRAFAPGDGPQLVLKSIQGWHFPAARARLRAAAAGRPDIHFIDAYESQTRQRALMAACDAYVSLHRAEGYGLTMAEAMAAAKPVVATGYSGNLEFMTDDNSLLVPYDLRPIPLGCDPYPAGTAWAEPDVDAAATLFRRLASDEELAERLGTRAASDMATLHSPAARTELVCGRIEQLRRAQ